MADPYAFKPGKLPATCQFLPRPGRLMDVEDIHILLEGGREVGDTVRVCINRSTMLELDPSDFATQWHRDGIPILGENGRTYTYQEADRGHSIGCWVTDAKKLDSPHISVI